MYHQTTSKPNMKNIFTAAFVLCSLLSFGSHSIGGTISWQNVGQNQFVFKLKLVTKCLGPAASPSGYQNLQTPFGVVQLSLKGSVGYTPTCEVAYGIWCNSINTSSWVLTTMVYYSDTITVSGTPPASGWKFYHLVGTRPSTTVNLQVGSTVNTEIFAMMYPETVLHNLSSPDFVDTYSESITPYNKTLTNQAFSNQSGDSLYYKLVAPISNNSSPYTFTSGYNYLTPFPTATNDPANGSMMFNPYTGEIEVDVQNATDGYYGYTVAVEQWKMIDNGQMTLPVKVSEVRKDNLIPVMTANSSTNSTPIVSIDTAVYQNVYRGTATAYGVKASIGDTVRFRIQAIDTDLDSNFVLQTTTFEASGAALDSTWGGWELYSSIPEITPGPGQTGFVSSGNNMVDFKWFISPDLVDIISNAYHTFKFSFTDNNCEFKGKASISVVIGIAALQDTTSSGVGVSELSKTAINIYPNPAKESFTVGGLKGKSQIQILGIQGKLIQTYSTTENSLEVKRENLSAGIYFLKILDSNTTSLQKVLFK